MKRNTYVQAPTVCSSIFTALSQMKMMMMMMMNIHLSQLTRLIVTYIRLEFVCCYYYYYYMSFSQIFICLVREHKKKRNQVRETIKKRITSKRSINLYNKVVRQEIFCFYLLIWNLLNDVYIDVLIELEVSLIDNIHMFTLFYPLPMWLFETKKSRNNKYNISSHGGFTYR